VGSTAAGAAAGLELEPESLVLPLLVLPLLVPLLLLPAPDGRFTAFPVGRFMAFFDFLNRASFVFFVSFAVRFAR
jgi:ABC-type transport system involved in cytochrome c biogenesis permease component